jgi:PmbA protein
LAVIFCLNKIYIDWNLYLMSETKETEQLEILLRLAEARGANAAEVYRVTSRSLPIYFEANRLKQMESSQSQGTALRLWHDNRPGLAVAYGQIQPDILVDKAIAIARLNSPETIELTAAKKEIHDDSKQLLSVENLVEIGETAIASLRLEYPELICSAELEGETETTILLNSQGLNCQYTETASSFFLGAELIRGEDFLGVYDGEYSKDNLNPDLIVKQIRQRLHWAKQNVAAPQGKIPVLFTGNEAGLFWGTISAALNAKRVVEASSPWSDRQERLVLSELLTLSQQPTLRPYNCPFDDEGTSTQELTLIDRGILRSFYSDLVTARELGLNSTGNGFRPGLDSYPSPALVNLIVEPGSASLSELISQLDDGIIVDRVLGGGADISGDFSVNVDLGYRVKQGKVIGRIKDTAIAGNVYELLQNVVALGADSTWNGSCYTPSLIVEGLSVVSS